MSDRDIDAARRAAVNSAADFLQGIAKLKNVGERIFPKPAETQRRRDGDLLFDLMRLNTDYLTRLGELSREHRDFTTRSLERLYHGLASALPEARVDELKFGKAQGWTRSFVLENTVDPHSDVATLECSAFQGPRPSAPLRVQPTISADGWDAPQGRLHTPYRSPVKIEVSLDVLKFDPARTYRADLTLKLGGRTRRMRLIVEREETR